MPEPEFNTGAPELTAGVEFTAQLADRIGKWKDSWTSRYSGPFTINGVTRDLLLPEQIAAEQPEEDAYQAVIDYASEGIVGAVATDEAEEVIEDISRTFNSKLTGGQSDIKAHVFKDILIRTVRVMADQAATSASTTNIAPPKATKTSGSRKPDPSKNLTPLEAHISHPDFGLLPTREQALTLSRYLLSTVVGATGMPVLTQRAISEYSAHNGQAGFSVPYVSQLLSGAKRGTRKAAATENAQTDLFRATYELSAVVAPEELMSLPGAVREQAAELAGELETRDHMTLPGAIIEPRSYNYVVRTDVQEAIDRAMSEGWFSRARITGGPNSGISSLVNYASESAKRNVYYPIVIDLAITPADSTSAEWAMVMSQLDPTYDTSSGVRLKDLMGVLDRLENEHLRLVLLLDNCEPEDHATSNFTSMLRSAQSRRSQSPRERSFAIIEFGHDDNGATTKYLDNFSQAQVTNLARAMGKDPNQVAKTFALTKGQPYLTHLLLHYNNELRNPVVQHKIDEHVAKVAEYIVASPYAQPEFVELMKTGKVSSEYASELTNPSVVSLDEEQGIYTWSIDIFKDRLPQAVQSVLARTRAKVIPELRDLFT